MGFEGVCRTAPGPARQDGVARNLPPTRYRYCQSNRQPALVNEAGFGGEKSHTRKLQYMLIITGEYAQSYVCECSKCHSETFGEVDIDDSTIHEIIEDNMPEIDPYEACEATNLIDQQKVDLFLQVYKNIPVAEFDSFMNKYR